MFLNSSTFWLLINIQTISALTEIWYDEGRYDTEWPQYFGDVTIGFVGSDCPVGTGPCIRIVGNSHVSHSYVTTTNLNNIYLMYDIKMTGWVSGDSCKIQIDYDNAPAVWNTKKQYSFLNVDLKGEIANFGVPAEDNSLGISIRLDNDGSSTFNCYFDNLYLYGTLINTEAPTNGPIQPTNNPTHVPTNIDFYIFDSSGLWYLAMEVRNVACDNVIDIEIRSSGMSWDSPDQYRPDVCQYCWQFDGNNQGGPYNIPIDIRIFTSNYPSGAAHLEWFGILNSISIGTVGTPDPSVDLCTLIPTINPTIPTSIPTDNPTPAPTNDPTPTPTQMPTLTPTDNPTQVPTQNPTTVPTSQPTQAPTVFGHTLTMQPSIIDKEMYEMTTGEGGNLEENKTKSKNTANTRIIMVVTVVVLFTILIALLFVYKQWRKRMKEKDINTNNNVEMGNIQNVDSKSEFKDYDVITSINKTDIGDVTIGTSDNDIIAAVNKTNMGNVSPLMKINSISSNENEIVETINVTGGDMDEFVVDGDSENEDVQQTMGEDDTQEGQ